MQITLGGVRGTRVATGRGFTGFGGDTTSFLVTGEEGERVVVDLGTGLGGYGEALGHFGVGAEPGLVLMTHYHLDHVSGFPTFGPIYDPSVSLRILGPDTGGDNGVRGVFNSLMAQPFWPLQVEMLSAALSFDVFPVHGEGVRCGGVLVRGVPVHHPGGCLAYRFDEKRTGASLVIATDVEWAESSEAERAGFLELCKGADVVLFDAHYTPGNYGGFRGWGHSTWADALEAGRRAGVGQVCAIHHAPDATDADLEEREAEAKTCFPEVVFGRQGARLNVGG